jgi:hypothetical protein
MKSFARYVAAAIIFVLLAPPALVANEKHPALPSRVLFAKTVYVDNQTTSAELQNTAYTELAKWGRLQMVDDPQKADIILRLSSGNSVKFVPGGDNAPAYDPKIAKNNFAGADEAVPPGSTRVSLIDPKSGNSLWSDVRKTNNPKAATHMLDGLRAQFEQKEK